MSVEQVCAGLPKEFSDFLSYCRCLEYEQKPNYRNLKKKFSKLFAKLGHQFDSQFDWVTLGDNKDAITQSTADTIPSKNFCFKKK